MMLTTSLELVESERLLKMSALWIIKQIVDTMKKIGCLLRHLVELGLENDSLMKKRIY